MRVAGAFFLAKMSIPEFYEHVKVEKCMKFMFFVEIPQNNTTKIAPAESGQVWRCHNAAPRRRGNSALDVARESCCFRSPGGILEGAHPRRNLPVSQQSAKGWVNKHRILL